MLSFVTLIFGLCREASNNEFYGLIIEVGVQRVDAELIVKGEVTLNENGFFGMYPSLNTNTNLEINVESGATLNSCGNIVYDIYGFVFGNLIFSGDGSYTCSLKQFLGDGAVVEPDCQDCPSN